MKEKLINAMLSRKSVRTFESKKIAKDDLEKIKEYISNPENYFSPFGSEIRMEVLDHNSIEVMGAMKNAFAFVVLIIKNNMKSLIDAGFVFENFILFLETMGIATCYLNTGFKRESVKLNEALKNDEIIILATPVGYEASKKSIMDKGTRMLIKCGKRKEIDEIFYSDFEKSPVKDVETRKKLDYVRWAPSAINAQPWRIVLAEEKAYFYINQKQYNKKRSDYNIHILDIGIAVSHYALIFDKKIFIIEENVKDSEDMKYLLTVY